MATAHQSRPRFTAIPVATLRVDTVTPFDLYLKSANDGRHVLYAKRDLHFSREQQKRLEDNRVATLFIDTRQEDDYQRYLEENLPAILSDKTVPVSKKTEALYQAAKGIVDDILESPMSAERVRRGKRISLDTLNTLTADRTAFETLVKSASYDYSLQAHCVNTSVYAVALALRAGIRDPNDLRDFAAGALLLDVGKSQVDDAILEHPGPLTLPQWDIVKQHTLFARDLLEPTGELGPIGLDVITHHHEYLDGAGYPFGLSGDEISVWARIAAIADTFDAITTNRPFQAAVSSFDALRIMSSEMRHALDPDFLRLFVELMGQRRR